MNYIDSLPLHIHRQILEYCDDIFKDPYTIKINNNIYTLYRESDINYIPKHVKILPCVIFNCMWDITEDGFVKGVCYITGIKHEIFFRGKHAIYIRSAHNNIVYHLTNDSNNKLIKHILNTFLEKTKQCYNCDKKINHIYDPNIGFQSECFEDGNYYCSKCYKNCVEKK